MQELYESVVELIKSGSEDISPEELNALVMLGAYYQMTGQIPDETLNPMAVGKIQQWQLEGKL